MDKKQSVEVLAGRIGMSVDDTSALLEAMKQSLISIWSELDTVLMPSLGTFTAVKEDERITVDLTSGNRVLLPPVISVKFTPSTVLRRKIADTYE